MFRALANKTLGIRLSALQRLFIIESEANLLQLFIHQLKTSALRSEARMLFFFKSMGIEKENHATFQCPFDNMGSFLWNAARNAFELLKKISFLFPDIGFPDVTLFPLSPPH